MELAQQIQWANCAELWDHVPLTVRMWIKYKPFSGTERGTSSDKDRRLEAKENLRTGTADPKAEEFQ